MVSASCLPIREVKAMSQSDQQYIELFLAPLMECASYRPAFGQSGDQGVDLRSFQSLYGSDPLYHWVGLDSELMYAAHKAAGGMTSIYRQLGTGCERLFRQIIKDELRLSDEQAAWSYEYDKGDGARAVHTLDARITIADISQKSIRDRLRGWIQAAAISLGLPTRRATSLAGVVFEIRQGYKSADSKRQAADIRFGIRAYEDADLLPVIAILSTQASDVVCRRYRDNRLLVLRGHLAGPDSTFAFIRDVVGYDLAAFFQRNEHRVRTEFTRIIGHLLTP
jgi:hypothetical protein